jgi:hypothetical protein
MYNRQKTGGKKRLAAYNMQQKQDIKQAKNKLYTKKGLFTPVKKSPPPKKKKKN